ncbi:MAG: class I SAM-dependent methyltransferase, partial [Acidobacteriota bacterium]|nr:class I SAM-dependent methyltransferase [Acidobacteriota bacterium]
MIDHSDYERKYADQYRDGSFETIMARIRREHALASVRRYPHARFLDVGCGFEPLFPHLDEATEAWIVEPGAEAVDAARNHPKAGDRVHIVSGFFEEVHAQLPPEFDFIAVSSLLHEVSDPIALADAIRAHCNTSTVVHFNVPNVRSFHRLLALEAGLIDDLFEKSETEKRFQRQTRFDMPTLRTFLEANGFEVVESGTYFVKPFTHGQLERMLRHEIIDERILAALDRMTQYMS